MINQISVVIPTFNRLKSLQITIDALLPQMHEGWDVLILDNCSDEPVISSLNIPFEFRKYVKVVRNIVNIGGNSNILRSLEYAVGEWVWVLGDDDPPALNAIDLIETAIGDFPDADFISFYHKNADFVKGLVPRQYNSLDKCFYEEPSISPIIFISSQIHRAASIRPGLRFGYHYTITCAPLLACYIGQGGRCKVVVHPEDILRESGIGAPDSISSYSAITLFEGIGLLRDIPTCPEMSKAVSRLLAKTTSVWRISTMVKMILFIEGPWVTRERRVYLLRQVLNRYFELKFPLTSDFLSNRLISRIVILSRPLIIVSLKIAARFSRKNAIWKIVAEGQRF